MDLAGELVYDSVGAEEHVESRAVVYYRRLLASYIVIVIVGVSLSAAIYVAAYRLAADQAQVEQLTILSQTTREIDLYLAELDAVTRRIANNRRFRLLIAGIDADSLVIPYRVYEAWDEIRYTLIDNPIIADALLVLPDRELVLTTGSIYLSARRHYGTLFGRIEGDMDAWLADLPNWGGFRSLIPIEPWSQGETVLHAASYVRSFPLDHESPSVAVVQYLIPEQTIRSVAHYLLRSRLASFALVGHEGAVLAGFGEDPGSAAATILTVRPSDDSGYFVQRINGVQSVVTYARSRRGDFLAIATLPMTDVLEPVRWVQRFSIVMLVLLVGIGLLVAWLSARSHARPFSEVITRNQQLSRTVDESLPHVRAAVLHRLLTGGFESMRELEAFVSQLDLPTSDQGYRLIVARIADYDPMASADPDHPLHRVRRKLLRSLEGRVGSRDLAFSFGGDSVYVLHPMEASAAVDDAAVIRVADLCAAAGRDTEMIVHVGAGGPVGDLFTLSRAFHEASEVVGYRRLGAPNAPLFYRDLPDDRMASPYYPIELEIRLEGSVRAGNVAQVTTILDDLYAANYQQRSLAPPMLRQFLSDLNGTLLRCRGETVRVDRYPSRVTTPDDVWLGEALAFDFDTVRADFLAFTRDSDAQKRSHNDRLRDQIVEYVAANLSDAGLCVSMAAHAHSLSEDYFSRYFHEQVGETFSHYVERGRIEHAKAMLTDSDAPIESIAAECGFGTVRTFRRAFKRRVGVTPSEFRALSTESQSVSPKV